MFSTGYGYLICFRRRAFACQRLVGILDEALAVESCLKSPASVIWLLERAFSGPQARLLSAISGEQVTVGTT
jgi:hypothetical protein